MTKTQAEDGLAPERDGSGNLAFVSGALQFVTASPRWVGTGRTVLDNKGNVVRQYEPFFSDTHEYENDDELVHWGVSPLWHYDPLGRNVRIDLPDGTFSTVVFSPWHLQSWDGADHVEDSAWHNARKSMSRSGHLDRRQLGQADRASQLARMTAYGPLGDLRSRRAPGRVRPGSPDRSRSGKAITNLRLCNDNASSP